MRQKDRKLAGFGRAKQFFQFFGLKLLPDNLFIIRHRQFQAADLCRIQRNCVVIQKSGTGSYKILVIVIIDILKAGNLLQFFQPFLMIAGRIIDGIICRKFPDQTDHIFFPAPVFLCRPGGNNHVAADQNRIGRGLTDPADNLLVVFTVHFRVLIREKNKRHVLSDFVCTDTISAHNKTVIIQNQDHHKQKNDCTEKQLQC